MQIWVKIPQTCFVHQFSYYLVYWVDEEPIGKHTCFYTVSLIGMFPLNRLLYVFLMMLFNKAITLI